MSNKINPAVVEFQVLNKVLEDRKLISADSPDLGLTTIKIQDSAKAGVKGYFDAADKVFVGKKEIKTFEDRVALFGALGLPLATLGGEQSAGFNLRAVGAYYFDRIGAASKGIASGTITTSESLDYVFLGEDADAIADLYSALSYAGVESPVSLMDGMFKSLATAAGIE